MRALNTCALAPHIHRHAQLVDKAATSSPEAIKGRNDRLAQVK